MKNKILVFIFCVVFIIFLLKIYNMVFVKVYYNSDFGIDNYYSNIDYDNDGIDDQTDILNSARSYVATKPIYKSKYYSTGYPDDIYGVCTDVVAFAFLNSGYDLMELVNNDIINNRDDYNIDKIDKNIDFRRVRNLIVFFENNAISLSTDINDIECFQGGDIVIFKNHIAIVSDKRNSEGIPYIIHNAGQVNYEEDAIGKYKIVGHYRWN